MSKIKEIDEIAQYQADVILETLKEQVEWAIADYDLNGDDYYNLRDYTVYQTVIKLLEQVDLVDDEKSQYITTIDNDTIRPNSNKRKFPRIGKNMNQISDKEWNEIVDNYKQNTIISG